MAEANENQTEIETTAIDRELAFFLDRLGGKAEGFRELVVRLHAHLRDGNTCLNLSEEECEAASGYAMVGPPGKDVAGEESTKADPATPMVLDGNRLYLRRYYLYERDIAAAIRQRVSALPASTLAGQDLAIERAAHARILVVSGGPGTGKTTLVARLLERVLSDDPTTTIRLAAPTGKAAARLGEALAEATAALPEALLPALPKQAETLHRLLRFRPRSILPTHGSKQRLNLDLLLIDEASMVDIALLAKTIRALPDHARLILLGDKDQLASVEAGAVLAELSSAAELSVEDGDGDLADHLVLLQKNYRFGEDSGIGQLAEAIRSGDAKRALAVLDDRDFPDATREQASIETLTDQYLRPLHEASSAAEGFAAFEQFQFLCATRSGPFGVEAVNRRVAAQLGIRPGVSWYEGRPILILKNAYHLRLFNGDVGIALTQADGVLRVAFPDAEASEGFRWLHPSRLPEHETVYAMTVHKSQGAQFGSVVLMLPDQGSRMLSRELVYTGVTRARERISLRGDLPAFETAVKTKTERHSGLSGRFF